MLQRSVWAGVVCCSVACGGAEPSSPGPDSRGIHLFSGANVTDSARARLTTPLIVEVHDSSGARAMARDQYGNARPDPIAWSVHRSGASVTTAGVVSGTVVGRYAVLASAAGVTDTVRFSALPQGMLAGYDVNRGEVVTIELDGSNRKVRTTAVNGGIGVRARWLAHSDDIIYSTFNNVIQELRVVDAAGVSVPFLPSAPSTMSHQADAAPSPDGSTVFFAAHDSRCPI